MEYDDLISAISDNKKGKFWSLSKYPVRLYPLVDSDKGIVHDYYDKVHGNISIDSVSKQIIETPEFSRLKNIKQLGLNYVVFPNATHTRFEHSVGTFHIANLLLSNLKEKQGGELEVEHGDTRNIATAALWHDLGHGPYSHTFDNSFLQVYFPKLNWSHEMGSIMLLEHMIDSNHLDIFEKSDITFITDLILGSTQESDFNSYTQSTNCEFNSNSKGWMFEIVNNKRNWMDVDKYDYIQRDSFQIDPTKYGFDFSVLTENALVIDNQIWYPIDIQKEWYGLFWARYKLFEEVYLNKLSQAAEVQICDIFIEANDYFRFNEIVQDMAEYKKLTDDIIDQIRSVDHPSLAKAHSLIDRMQNNDLYAYVGSKAYSGYEKSEFSRITPEKIAEFSDGALVADDIRLWPVRVNFGMGDDNPLKYVSFYDRDSNKNLEIVDDPASIETFVPPIKYVLDVFTTDKTKIKHVYKAFGRALKNLTGTDLE